MGLDVTILILETLGRLGRGVRWPSRTKPVASKVLVG
jgi:hypothetical protein